MPDLIDRQGRSHGRRRNVLKTIVGQPSPDSSRNIQPTGFCSPRHRPLRKSTRKYRGQRIFSWGEYVADRDAEEPIVQLCSMAWCCSMGALVGGVLRPDQPFSAVGDVHRDFKAKTHFGIGRRGPLHVQSPEFRVERTDADTAMSGIPRDKGASCMPRDPAPAAMAPSHPGTLCLDMGGGLVAARDGLATLRGTHRACAGW